MLNSISIIIPVYNEPNINYYLEDLYSKLPKKLNYEIIVVDGAENGSTLSLIETKKTRGFLASPGRATQQNFGADIAKKDILLFLHADTILPNDFSNLIISTINSGYDCGAFELEIKTNSRTLKLFTKVALIRSRLTKHPYGDQALFFTRSSFEMIGGFPEISLMEDIAIMQQAKKQKLRLRILTQKVMTSDRKYQKDGVIYSLLRNPILASLYYLGVDPEWLHKIYYKN